MTILAVVISLFLGGETGLRSSISITFGIADGVMSATWSSVNYNTFLELLSPFHSTSTVSTNFYIVFDFNFLSLSCCDSKLCLIPLAVSRFYGSRDPARYFEASRFNLSFCLDLSTSSLSFCLLAYLSYCIEFAPK